MEPTSCWARVKYGFCLGSLPKYGTVKTRKLKMANKTTQPHSWRLVTHCLFLKLKPSEKLVLEALA